jgi:ribonucleoside-triphosphate reductase
MPSMRALMTAGNALERENIAGYNCSYIPIDNPKAFDEVLYILMNGTGVGFSVERQYIDKLPTIPDREFEKIR